MWSEEILKIENKTLLCSIKHFEQGSEFGIDGGRISKLTVKDGTKDIINYDRGWDIKPESDISILAYKILMEKYN